MTNGANYKRSKLHHSPWHSDIRTSNQLNTSITWKQSSPLAHTFSLYTTRTTFCHTCENPHKPSNRTIAARFGTTQNRCCRDIIFAPIPRHFLRQIQCSWWEQKFIRHWWYQKESTNQPEANRILVEAICQKHGSAQRYYLQPVKESMGGLVSGEEALVNYPETVPSDTSSRWTAALGDGSCISFGDISEPAAFRNYW